MNNSTVRQNTTEQAAAGYAPLRDREAAYASATSSISAGMRVLTAAPTASVAGYWPTVGPLAGHTVHGAQPPVAELASASALIRLAEEHGAAQFAGAELEQARGKIQSAEHLAQIDPRQAQRLAEEANLDAQAALARVRAVRQRQSADRAAPPATASAATALPAAVAALPAAVSPSPPQAH